jgi:hypothetical protein
MESIVMETRWAIPAAVSAVTEISGTPNGMALQVRIALLAATVTKKPWTFYVRYSRTWVSS